MSTLATVSLYLLGLAILIFGANMFFNFMPPRENMPEAAGAFLSAFVNGGYILPTLGVHYVLAGLLLVLHKAVPFALIILIPVF